MWLLVLKNVVFVPTLYQIRRGQRLSTRSLPKAVLLNRWDNVDRAMIIIFEYVNVTIKEIRDPICNVVHIIELIGGGILSGIDVWRSSGC